MSTGNATAKLKGSGTGLLILKWAICLGVPLILLLMMNANNVFEPALRNYIAITLGTILVWIFNVLPIVISGLIMMLLYILTNVAGADVVLSPWTGPIVWLVVGGMIIAVAFEKTGLMKRIAYFTIRKSGYSYRGIVIGLIVSGVIMAALMPNIVGRVTLYSALAFGICKALDLKPGSKTGAGIMLSGFLATVAGQRIVLTGDDNLFIALSYVSDTTNVSWMDHFIANAPTTILWVALMIVMVLVLFKQDVPFEGKTFFDEEAKKMGKMKASEIKFLAILLATIGFLIFSQIQLGWIFLAAACLCFVPGINIMDMEDMKKVNFPMVIFVACAMAIGNVATSLGVGTMVGEAFIEMVGDMQLTDYMFMPLVWLFGVIVNLLMTPLAATAAFTVPIVSIAADLGLSTIGAIYSFVWGVVQFVFPYEWVVFLITFSYGMFDNKATLKFGGVMMALSLVFLLAVLIPFWMLTGFLK